MTTPFEAFVNAELPYRVSSLTLEPTAGYIPQSTGNGMQVEWVQASSLAPVQSVNGSTGNVTLTAASVGADPSGSAANAQAAAVQRVNHTGTQLASTISDFSAAAKTAVVGSANGVLKGDGAGNVSAAAASDYVKSLYTHLANETWLIDDFTEYYGTAHWQQTVTNAWRSYVTGASYGMADAMGVLRFLANANTAGGYVTCGWATTSSINTVGLHATNPVILVASFSIDAFDTAGSAQAYYVSLGNALYPVTSVGVFAGANGICLWIYKDAGGSIYAQCVTTDNAPSDPSKTDSYAAPVSITTNSRVNVVIVATSGNVKYYLNGTLFREVTDSAKIPTQALSAQVGFQTAVGSSVGGMSIDLVALGRKFVTPRALQLPTV